MKTFSTASAALAASLALVACGGNDDDAPVPPPAPAPAPATAVPDSAIASPAALVSYLGSQKTDDESSEALTLPDADAATSETDEPKEL